MVWFFVINQSSCFILDCANSASRSVCGDPIWSFIDWLQRPDRSNRPLRPVQAVRTIVTCPLTRPCLIRIMDVPWIGRWSLSSPGCVLFEVGRVGGLLGLQSIPRFLSFSRLSNVPWEPRRAQGLSFCASLPIFFVDGAGRHFYSNRSLLLTRSITVFNGLLGGRCFSLDYISQHLLDRIHLSNVTPCGAKQVFLSTKRVCWCGSRQSLPAR